MDKYGNFRSISGELPEADNNTERMYENKLRSIIHKMVAEKLDIIDTK